MHRHGRWLFYRDPGQLWRWEEYDGDAKLVNKSMTGFASMSNCVVDAKLYGYTDASTDGATLPEHRQ